MGNRCADPGALPKRPVLTIPLGPPLQRASRTASPVPYSPGASALANKKSRLQSLILPEPAAGQKKGRRDLIPTACVADRSAIQPPESCFPAASPIWGFIATNFAGSVAAMGAIFSSPRSSRTLTARFTAETARSCIAVWSIAFCCIELHWAEPASIDPLVSMDPAIFGDSTIFVESPISVELPIFLELTERPSVKRPPLIQSAAVQTDVVQTGSVRLPMLPRRINSPSDVATSRDVPQPVVTEPRSERSLQRERLVPRLWEIRDIVSAWLFASTWALQSA